MSCVTVEKRSDDGLHREEWRFWLGEGITLVLDIYVEATRKTKRSPWRSLRSYSRFADGPYHDIGEADVPIPLDVQQRAIALVTHQLRVMKWGEYNT